MHPENDTAINIWQAKPGLRGHRFEVHEPGLHHLAFNVERHEQIDPLAGLIPSWGGTLLEGPGAVMARPIRAAPEPPTTETAGAEQSAT